MYTYYPLGLKKDDSYYTAVMSDFLVG